MRLAQLLVFLPFVVLVSCNDDDNKPTALTGAFVDSAVAGLRFATPTQSGLTSTAGEFRYLPGETVTFTIGGIALGSAAGAAQVSPFDLYQLTPPASSRALTAQLDDPGITDLMRVANVAALLVQLDTDHNPDNGIDLGSADSVLADATLSFDATLYDFYGVSLRPLLSSHNLGDASAPQNVGLTHLYASLGLKVPVAQRASTTTDGDADGTPDSVSTVSYDARGLRSQTTQDSNADGTIERRSTYTYNARGLQLTQIGERQPVGDGTFHVKLVTTVNYDANGYVVGSVTEDMTDGVLTERDTATAVIDAHGNRLSESYSVDEGADGTPNLIRGTTYTYDNRGLVLTSTSTSDNDADGTPNSRSIVTNTYDAANNRVLSIYQQDEDNDGVFDTTYTTATTYDAHHRLLSEDSKTQDAGGIVTSRQVYASTYDANSRQLTYGYTYYNASPTPTQISRTAYTYDTAGRLIVESSGQDNDADGHDDATSVYTYSYDAAGNQAQAIELFDSTNDGTPDRKDVYAYTYDAEGYELTRTIQTDIGNDGSVEGTSGRAFAYTTIADGVFSFFSAIFAD